MNKFNFSLQRLMDYKEILLNEEISKIQHINKQINDCEENISKVTDRLDSLLNHIECNKTHNVAILINYKRYINDLKVLRKSFIAQRNGLEKSLEFAREKATTLQKEHKTIVSLKERKFDEYKKELSINEQLELDDLVSSRRA